MFLFSKVKSQRCSPSAHQTRDTTAVRRLKCYCSSLQGGSGTGQFLWVLFAWRPKPSEAKPAGRDPSPPVNVLDHLLHHQVWEAEARSAAASLWLGRLSPELEALAARRRVGVSGWNSSTNFYKQFIYVYRIFRAGLHKNCMDGVGIVLSISLHDFSDVHKITLIPGNSNDDIGRAVLPEFFHPVLQRWECLFFCDVVNNDGRSRASVVHRR